MSRGGRRRRRKRPRGPAPPRPDARREAESRAYSAEAAPPAAKAGPTGPPPRPAGATWGRLTAFVGGMARTRGFFPAVLVVFTAAIYARSIPQPLHHYDDADYIYEDRRVERLSPGNAWLIVRRSFHANYHPLTTFTFALDRAVWGVWLPGFHLTQIAFYAAGIVMVYYLFRTLLGSRWAAFAAAAVFSAHAVHVESVAWLASRKDVVCLFFYVSAMLAYLRYSKEAEFSGKRYAAFLALAVAAMFSKGYAAVMPAVLLAYDACFAERFRLRHILDKVPLFCLGAILTFVMIAAQEKDAAPLPGGITIGHRSFVLSKVFSLYTARAILPVRLSALYEVAGDRPGTWAAVLGAGLLLAALAGFFRLRRRLPVAAFGIGVYLLQLGPVMNTFFMLRLWMADRYLLFPTIGSTLALAAAAVWFYRRRSIPAGARRWGLGLAVPGTVALYSVLTVVRIGAWTSTIGLWSDCLRKVNGLPGSGAVTVAELRRRRPRELNRVALTNLAQAYKRRGRPSDLDEARAIGVLLESAAGAVPQELGLSGEIESSALRDIEAGRYDEGIAKLRRIAEGGAWRAPAAWVLIGQVHVERSELDSARAAYLKALEMFREDGRSGGGALLALGKLEFDEGNFEQAEEWFRTARAEASRLDPRPSYLLGVSLARLGRLEEALGLFEETLGLEGRIPQTIRFDFANVCLQMAIAAETLKDHEKAVRSLERALLFSPRHDQHLAMRLKIGQLAEGLGRPEKAVGRYEEVLGMAPDHPDAGAIRARIELLRERKGKSGGRDASPGEGQPR